MPSSIRDRSEATPATPAEGGPAPKDPALPLVRVRYNGPPKGAQYGGRKLVPGDELEVPALDAVAQAERWPGIFVLVDPAGARAAADVQRALIDKPAAPAGG